MKKCCFGKLHYCLLLMLLSFSITHVNAQSNYNTTNWKFSNPSQFGFAVFELDYFDDNNVLAVGGDGGIAKSTDGGRNWTYGPFTFVKNDGLWTKPSFIDVHFVSATVAYAVGNNGCMAKTSDGGATWTLVKTPLYNNAKNINAVWFVNENTGYIGGEWNTMDSIPKLYVTNNGGATWDSLAAPIGGKTRVGYINNPNVAPQIWDVTAKGKTIHRIEFTSPTTGYITGGGQTHFPPFPAVNTTTCLPTGGMTSTGGNNAALVWKFSNGTLTDYSLSKERLGYSGIVTNTVACNTQYNASQVIPAPQQYRAMKIIHDSLIVLMSLNNNVVVRVYTGVNDKTVNQATGQPENGRYQITSSPAMLAGPDAHPPIPNPNNNLFSNPYNIRKAADGKLFAATNFGTLWTSADTGRTWVRGVSLPQGKNYSSFFTPAFDISPSGRFLSAGGNGVVADSAAGAQWRSDYNLQVTGSYESMEFADCNNGMATGGPTIAVTNDGGKTWFDRTRTDFANLFISINGQAYATGNPAVAYLSTSAGNIYKSVDMNVAPPATPALDPVYANPNYQMWDIATAGKDSVWACGYSTFSVPAASRIPVVVRSIDGGTTWTAYTSFFPGTNFQNFKLIEFPTHLTGYLAGNRDTIWKTTDGGVTWNKLPLPTPGVTPQITYTDMFALDANTVFLTGNGFPRRVVFKTTDGGATWQDITNNIATTYSNFGNLNSVVFHDASNGYVSCPGGGFLKTTDGGATWTHDIAPTSVIGGALTFAPKKVTGSVPFQNRKLFMTGVPLPNTAGHILEYGNPANINVNTTETTLNATCTSVNGGRITITATGGIAPYTYSINGGAFQSSNVFTGLTQGTHTITIKDAYCGTLTKTVTVGFTNNLVVNAGPDKSIVFGGTATLNGTSSNTPQTIQWTPANSLTGATTLTPVAKPDQTTQYTLTVTDQGGCVAKDSAVVTVINECIKVMEAFTPNGDGINDKWMVTNGSNCSTKLSVSVFNRYGGTVYKNDNYNNDWNGTYNGKPVADGTYYYVATIYMIGGRIDQVKGNVTILR